MKKKTSKDTPAQKQNPVIKDQNMQQHSHHQKSSASIPSLSPSLLRAEKPSYKQKIAKMTDMEKLKSLLKSTQPEQEITSFVLTLPLTQQAKAAPYLSFKTVIETVTKSETYQRSRTTKWKFL
jgi:hypothetical protein